MFLRELTQPIPSLGRGAAAAAPRFARQGIVNVGQLLGRFPREYDDRTVFVPFGEATENARVHTFATVTAHDHFGYGRMRTLKLTVSDGAREADLVCFNRPFLASSFPIGSRVIVTGTFQYRYGRLQAGVFDLEHAESPDLVERGLLPVYPLTGGLAQKTVRRLVRVALDRFGAGVEDELPGNIVSRRQLLPKSRALGDMHFPGTTGDLVRARDTLAYEELFHFQLAVARRALQRRRIEVTRAPLRGLLARRFVQRLPFELTPDQRRACDEIARDLERPHPMARLLQGDVGSGKTLVALVSCLHVVEAGGQAVILAPTELLARQHAATAAALLEPLGVRLAFLTGSIDDASRKEVLAALASGGLDIVLGTHALFSDDVAYADLRLAVVDEQHRFGVLQRSAFGRKGSMPDLLMMTATPIPRTLALTLFGDLSVSTIRTMPPGRKPVVTHLARIENDFKVYEFVRGLLEQGRQAYFVYPLIGESEKADIKHATGMAEKLAREWFRGHRVGLLHSRMKESEKVAVMDGFVRGEIRVLVATTVVEVGVDVPRAAAMVVEHAERFGLAALHQLRGRVGRGDAQSYCFLVYAEPLTEDAKARLKAMLATTDGFVLAEEDLRIRGPGELSGTIQSGALRLAVADPVRDLRILELAREDAYRTVAEDPELSTEENAVLRAVLSRAPPFTEAGIGGGELQGAGMV